MRRVMMIETCYNRDTSDNRIEVMKVELGAQLFLLVPPLMGEEIKGIVKRDRVQNKERVH